ERALISFYVALRWCPPRWQSSDSGGRGRRLQPESHAHAPAHVLAHGKVLISPGSVPDTMVQAAQVQVAEGLERPKPERSSDLKRLFVPSPRYAEVTGGRRHSSETPSSVRDVSLLAALVGQPGCSLGVLDCIIEATGPHASLAEVGRHAGLIDA